MFSVYSDVKPGAGCTMVVPQSVSAATPFQRPSRPLRRFLHEKLCTTQHHKTLAAAAETDGSLDALSELRGKIVADPAAYGIDTSQGIELPASAGSLVIFCPFALHSASVNRGAIPRHVNVQSFNHSTDADLLQEHLLKTRYLQKFHASRPTN